MTLPPGVAAQRLAVSVYRDTAKRKGLEWALTFKQAVDIMTQDCHYCGDPPSFVTEKHWPRPLNGTFTRNGIDRVDNTRGYTLDNVVPCCRQCNSAKGQMSSDEFYALVQRIHRHQGGD